jgi:hypothetical protein
MLDVTMCPGRAPAQVALLPLSRGADERQKWFVPFDEEAAACALFWDVARLAPTDEAIRTRAYFLWLAAGRPHGTAEAHWYAAQAQLVAAAAALVRDGLP